MVWTGGRITSRAARCATRARSATRAPSRAPPAATPIRTRRPSPGVCGARPSGAAPRRRQARGAGRRRSLDLEPERNSFRAQSRSSISGTPRNISGKCQRRCMRARGGVGKLAPSAAGPALASRQLPATQSPGRVATVIGSRARPALLRASGRGGRAPASRRGCANL